jgi:hypothetical protein
MYTINRSTGAATSLGIGSFNANALGNYGAGLFYAADYYTGNFYDIDLSNVGSEVSIVAAYSDVTGAAYVSHGDIWVTADGTVYATVATGGTAYLVTVDPSTAIVTTQVALPSGAWYGLTENEDGLLLVYEDTGSVYEWDGSTLSDSTIVPANTVFGATTIPVPSAVLLGILGLTAAGAKLRRRRA